MTNNYEEVRNYLINSLQEVADTVDLEQMSDFELLDHWMIYHGILTPDDEPLLDRLKLLKDHNRAIMFDVIGTWETIQVDKIKYVKPKK